MLKLARWNSSILKDVIDEEKRRKISCGFKTSGIFPKVSNILAMIAHRDEKYLQAFMNVSRFFIFYSGNKIKLFSFQQSYFNKLLQITL